MSEINKSTIINALEKARRNPENPLSEVLLDIGKIAHELFEANEEQLKHIANLEKERLTDRRTNIPSLAAFIDKMQPELEAYFDDGANARKYPKDFVVMFADLDDLKVINDTLGHSKGDDAIIECAQTLISSVREVDWVSRHGEHADEFIIVLRIIDEDDATLVEELVRSRIIAKALSSGFKGFSISIGSAIASQYESLGDVLEAAEADMYANKEKTKQNKVIDMHATVDITE